MQNAPPAGEDAVNRFIRESGSSGFRGDIGRGDQPVQLVIQHDVAGTQHQRIGAGDLRVGSRHAGLAFR